MQKSKLWSPTLRDEIVSPKFYLGNFYFSIIPDLFKKIKPHATMGT